MGEVDNSSLEMSTEKKLFTIRAANKSLIVSISLLIYREKIYQNYQ